MVVGFLISLAGVGLWHITDRYGKSSWLKTFIYRLLMLGGIIITIVSIVLK